MLEGSYRYGIDHFWTSTLKKAKEDRSFTNNACFWGVANSGFYGKPKNKKYGWTYLVMKTQPYNLEYRDTFFKELVDRFSSMLKVWYYRSREDKYGRVIIRIHKDTPMEWVFMFGSMCRHGWEHIQYWPKQDKPPTAKEVFVTYLIKKGFNNLYGYQISHSIWYYRDNRGKQLGITAEVYVDEVFKIIEDGVVPYSSTMAEDTNFRLGSPLWNLVKERISGKKEKEYDPFED